MDIVWILHLKKKIPICNREVSASGVVSLGTEETSPHLYRIYWVEDSTFVALQGTRNLTSFH